MKKAVQDRKAALVEAHTIVEELTNTGAYVVMEAPLPVLFTPPYRCSDWFNRMNPIGANGLTVSREFLKRIDYIPTVASDASEALKILQKRSFDLVISDIIMPGMDGIQFMQEAKRSFPHLNFIIIHNQNIPG